MIDDISRISSVNLPETASLKINNLNDLFSSAYVKSSKDRRNTIGIEVSNA